MYVTVVPVNVFMVDVAILTNESSNNMFTSKYIHGTINTRRIHRLVYDYLREQESTGLLCRVRRLSLLVARCRGRLESTR